MLEAARILKSLGVKPKATLRFLFFSGEEQGCLGSRAYLEAHKTELNLHRMFLFMDGGAQMPIGISPKGRHDLVDPLKPLVEPLRVVGANRVIPDSEIGSDDEAFIALGIPTIELMTEPGDYDTTHHSIADTLDKIDPRALSADTAAMALTALAIADSEQAPGPRLRGSELSNLITKIGMLEEAKMLRGTDWKPE